MEDNNIKKETNKNGMWVLCGVFIVGYILGGASANKQIAEFYNRGFKDGIDTLMDKVK